MVSIHQPTFVSCYKVCKGGDALEIQRWRDDQFGHLYEKMMLQTKQFQGSLYAFIHVNGFDFSLLG